MSDGSIIIDTKVDSSGAEKGIKSLGGMASAGLSGIATAGKAMGVALGVATVAVGGLVKASVEQYSQYEQLTGGVETLFKNSSGKVMEYANNAYKTAGMSANEYMSTITGFSASLLQGLGGDTEKAAEVGNRAVTDMSDNANKMGTGIENIQNAYQGFAKQNYTMLDNLKLGYGGTKTEMQRLLADAEKLTGIHYDISNFSDVIEAIHVIQGEMGITGTTAKEAMSTIEGSLNMTKSAWSNLLTGMADDNADFDKLIDNLVESIGALGENLLPRIEIAIGGVAQLIEKLLPPIMDKVPQIILDVLPKLVNAGMQIIQNLVTGIQSNLNTISTTIINIATTIVTGFFTLLPQILGVGMQIIASLATGIGQSLPTLIPLFAQCITSLLSTLALNLPMLIDAGMQIINGLIQGLLSALPMLIGELPQIINNIVLAINYGLPQILQMGIQLIQSLVDGIIQNLPILIAQIPQIITTIVSIISQNLQQITSSAISIMTTLINGLIQALPQLIAMLPQIISTIINVITQNLPLIIQAGITILIALINGLTNALPQLIAMLPEIINTVVNTLLAHLPEIILAGVQILVAIIGGLIQTIPKLVGALPQIISAIIKAFTSVNWLDIGINIIKGIGQGILNTGDWLWQQAKSVCSGLKDKITGFFDIHSPSRVMRDLVGVNLVKGIGVGLDQESSNLYADAEELCSKLQTSIDFNTAKTTANITASANRAAGITNSSTTTNNDNGAKVYIDKFIGTDKQNVQELAQEIAFLSKRKPV